ncbi:NAD(P)H-dependent oxidoreductase [Agromyces seonyuensis]|uniref:NAD(P)H-dependent oxidoreductase n=1 Tax=Agromyces seonyuensis TaxID=2662446 RepID=UPI001F30C081|nr:NAD(P)H-dependent oxidoreductase [Agromyces seonyuensis]
MNVLVVIGHPLAGSFGHALAASYADAARAAGAEVRVIDLAERRFPHDPVGQADLHIGRDGSRDHLDPGIVAMIDDVEWADHLLIVYPQWWGTYPAALSAFFDRVFLSGFAFARGSGPISERLLTGRTARIVMTMDSPGFWHRFVYRTASDTAISRATLGFTGIRTTGITRLASVRFASAERRAGWLARTGAQGRADATARPRRGARRDAVAA